MKLNRFFMLGLAGLAFAACSNEEDVTNNQLNVKNGAVSVRIVKPAITKALSPEGTVAIKGKIKITLTGKSTADAPISDYEKSIEIDAQDLDNTTELKFWNIAVPEKLTATINSGKNTYTDVNINTLWQTNPESAPAYGEVLASEFTLSGGTESPVLSEDEITEAGAVAGDDEKEYDMYKATVKMAIPMSRLEVGEITLDGTQTVYASLDYSGCYLDHYATYGSTYSNGAFPASADDLGNYWFEDDIAGGAGQSVADLRIPANPGHDFVTTPIGEAGAFNFYAGSANPHFKLYFKDGDLNPGTTSIGFPRYAIVTNYLNEEGTPITLENGHIYQIKNATLDAENLIPDEEGNNLYGVTVTVVEAVWTVHTVTGDWVEQ